MALYCRDGDHPPPLKIPKLEPAFAPAPVVKLEPPVAEPLRPMQSEEEERPSHDAAIARDNAAAAVNRSIDREEERQGTGDDGATEATTADLPDDFLEPLPIDPTQDRLVVPHTAAVIPPAAPPPSALYYANLRGAQKRGSRQFWKAGDYEGDPTYAGFTAGGGIDRVRVHPKFLHSNATSHKWALGAVAELLDNAVDEVMNGATFVNVDMIRDPRDGGPMLIIEDDGGGMSPDRLRQCMSLGYSVKSKSANTIGQYGNGFKTSTMRLGADVIVFTRCPRREDSSATQSIGMLSYSFLRDTSQEDIIVPMIDYDIEPFGLKKLIRNSVDDWTCNLDTITQWSPYCSESDLLNQFSGMKSQGTKIILYNLWEDDQGELELDFDSNIYDIQVRGANRDEKKVTMAARFPNSRHYLTYRYSLRSYASILYLRLPPGFRMILRGIEIDHHNLVDDLMHTQEQTYKPHGGPDSIHKETNMMAVVTIGFVKDAKEHVDVQGFNVYHKNRLIKPFWRIWNSASSQGRGIIGVLEANFVEPAHDKQGFERTIVLGRLEQRLLQMQKQYWNNNCHKIGYYSAKKRDGPRMSYPPRGGLRSETQVRASNESWAIVSRVSPPQESLSQPLEATPCKYSSAYNSGEGSAHPMFFNSTTNGALDMRFRKHEECMSPEERFGTSREEYWKEVEKNKQLEAKVLDLEHKMDDIRKLTERVVKERDSLRTQLEAEIRLRSVEDEDLRKKLKDAHSRIRQLEAENKCKHASYF